MIHLKRFGIGLVWMLLCGGTVAGFVLAIIHFPKLFLSILIPTIAYVGGAAWLDSK